MKLATLKLEVWRGEEAERLVALHGLTGIVDAAKQDGLDHAQGWQGRTVSVVPVHLPQVTMMIVHEFDLQAPQDLTKSMTLVYHVTGIESPVAARLAGDVVKGMAGHISRLMAEGGGRVDVRRLDDVEQMISKPGRAAQG